MRPVARLLLHLAALCLCLAALPNRAAAQTVTVQSGEHADFSRLALVFPRETAWDSRQTDGELRITFSPEAALDTSRVFELIPRDRIAAAGTDPENGALVLDLNCPCDVDIFQTRANVVVIDVRDAPETAETSDAPAQGSAPDTALPPALPAGLLAEAARVPSGLRPFAPSPFALEPPTPNPSSENTPNGAEPAPRPVNARTEAPPSTDLNPSDDPAEALAAALDADLRRAAEAGLIDLTDEARDTPAFDEDALPNLDLRTVFDPLPGSADERKAEALNCPRRRLFAFMEDRPAEQIVAALPTLRAGLVTALGDLSPNGARALAEAYLALGFGVEAAQLIREAGLAPRSEALLTGIARLVDMRSEERPDTWEGLQGCPSPVALWAMLGQAPGLPAPTIHADAVQASFAALPDHMRLHLGPVLADRLLRARLPGAARAVENNFNALLAATAEPLPQSLAEEPETPVPPGPIVQPSPADQRLAALLERIDAALANGTPPPDEDLALARALEGEMAGTPEGARLRDAGILGALAGAGLEDGLTALQERRPDADRRWEIAFTRAVSAALARQSDAGLARLALLQPPSATAELLADADLVDAAERLRRIGFPEAALSFLETRPLDDDLDPPLATAAALLDTGDPARALALLAGRDDADAALIRARAHTALGSFARAADAFSQAGRSADAARAAWLSGDAGAIAAHGTPAQQDLQAQLAARQSTDTPPDDGPTVAEPLSTEGDAEAPAAPAAGPAPDRPAQVAAEPGSLAAARALLSRGDEIRAAVDALERLGADTP